MCVSLLGAGFFFLTHTRTPNLSTPGAQVFGPQLPIQAEINIIYV